MKLSNFYGLPKVHKSIKIKSACEQCNSNYVEVENVDDLALRPIVADQHVKRTDSVIW